MARVTINRLTDRGIRVLGPGMHPDGGGLYLRVAAGQPDDNGKPVLSRYWVFCYKQRGTRKDRQVGLGPFDTVTLAAARAAARRCSSLVGGHAAPLLQHGHHANVSWILGERARPAPLRFFPKSLKLRPPTLRRAGELTQ